MEHIFCARSSPCCVLVALLHSWIAWSYKRAAISENSESLYCGEVNTIVVKTKKVIKLLLPPDARFMKVAPQLHIQCTIFFYNLKTRVLCHVLTTLCLFLEGIVKDHSMIIIPHYDHSMIIIRLYSSESSSLNNKHHYSPPCDHRLCWWWQNTLRKHSKYLGKSSKY